VVSKDRLVAEVWPAVVVAESSLAQAVADIRRCLGSDGHRLLRTAARRGYVLVPDAGSHLLRRRPDAPKRVALLSVAFLPFVAEGPDPDLPWLARALQSDLTTEVSRLMGSVVAGPETVSRFQGSLADPMLAARELGVRHVVRGALRREGDRIRLNISLLDGSSGLQRWADVFFVDHATAAQALGDFAIQVERALQPELYRACAASADSPENQPSDADALAVRAFAQWYGGFNRANVTRAIDLLRSAVELNPDAVRAWAGIGFMTYTAYCQGWGPERGDSQRRVEAAVGHLERLDRDGNYTYQCKAIAMALRAEWGRLLVHTRSWTQRHRHPSAFGVHGAVLLAHGEFDEAIAALQQALSLSPRDPFRADWQHRTAMCHWAAGRFEQACVWSQVADATNSVLGWPPIACAGLVRLGQADKARLAADRQTAWRAVASMERLDRLLPGFDPRWLRARDELMQDLLACGALPSGRAAGPSSG
jgi:TolB-like protein